MKKCKDYYYRKKNDKDICKREVACTKLGHVLLQGCSA